MALVTPDVELEFVSANNNGTIQTGHILTGTKGIAPQSKKHYRIHEGEYVFVGKKKGRIVKAKKTGRKK